MDFSSFLSLIKTIIILVIVIALANISLKFANKYMTKHNKIIKVVERVSVNTNSSLSVVDICGTYYLMSFAGDDNKILKELDKEEVDRIISEIEKNQTIAMDKNSRMYTYFSDLQKKIKTYTGARKKS